MIKGRSFRCAGQGRPLGGGRKGGGAMWAQREVFQAERPVVQMHLNAQKGRQLSFWTENGL